MSPNRMQVEIHSFLSEPGLQKGCWAERGSEQEAGWRLALVWLLLVTGGDTRSFGAGWPYSVVIIKT